MKPGHIPFEEFAVVADHVSTKGGLARRHVLLHEVENHLLGLRHVYVRRLAALDEPGGTMGTLIPGIHGIEHVLAMVNGDDGPFNHDFHVRTGHCTRDLDDHVALRVKSRHFAVDPHEIQGIVGEFVHF